MLRFAFRSPYEHCIAPLQKGGGGGGGRGKDGIHVKKFNNATRNVFVITRNVTVLFSMRINVVVGQGWTYRIA